MILKEQILELAKRTIEPMGYEIVDFHFNTHGKNWLLRFFIHKSGGITISDCVMVSNKIGEILDIEDLIPHRYILEISSPGLDRPLINQNDFIRNKGEIAKITFKNENEKVKELKGIIKNADENKVEIETENGEIKFVEYENISSAKLEIIIGR